MSSSERALASRSPATSPRVSWRAAFVILAIPAFFLAYFVFKLPEPVRGGQGVLVSELGPTANGVPGVQPDKEQTTDAQRLALSRGVRPDPRLLSEGSVRSMGFVGACRYVLHVRTNVALIISGACAYYFLAGVQTFGVEFTREQYHVNQVLANLLMLVVGGGAAAGVLVAGPLGDRRLGRGHLTGRIQVAAVAAIAVVALFIPVLITHSTFTALPEHHPGRCRPVRAEPPYRRSAGSTSCRPSCGGVPRASARSSGPARRPSPHCSSERSRIC